MGILNVDTHGNIINKTPQEIQQILEDIKSLYDSTNSFTQEQDSHDYGANIQNFVSHLQSRVGSNPATDLQGLIEADTTLDVDIIEAKNDMKISEDRVKSLRNMNKPSYYESWFPINRPLRNSTNIILISLGVFFYIFTFFMALSRFGIYINTHVTWLQRNDTSGIIYKLRYLFPFGYGTTIIFIVLICLFSAAYLRKL
jgi:hypothetical protein